VVQAEKIHLLITEEPENLVHWEMITMQSVVVAVVVHTAILALLLMAVQEVVRVLGLQAEHQVLQVKEVMAEMVL
jgi:hypothetical protein